MAESEHELKRAKAYQRQKQMLSLVGLVYTPAVFFAIVLTGLTEILRQWAGGLSDNAYLVAALYCLFFLIAVHLASLPLSFYSGYLLEHRFNLSNQNLGAWMFEDLKKLALSLVLSVPLLVGMYALIWRFTEQWWILGWTGYVMIMFVFGKLFPVFIVPIFYKYGDVEREDLKDRIRRMAGSYGMPIDKIYSLNLSKTTKKANAAFMGLGKSKRVVLSDTLLEHFSDDEIETVVAHELGHFVHKDIWKHLALGACISLLAFFLAGQAMDPMAVYFGLEGVENVAALPLLLILFYFISLTLMPAQNAFSRKMEYAADRFSLEIYPKRDVFISCMEKLASVNLADPAPNALYEWFFYDHPSIAKRIKRAHDILPPEKAA